MYDRPDICSACGGKCCKDYPGAAFPEDFNMTNDPKSDLPDLKTALESGLWTLDKWDGDPRDEAPCGFYSYAYIVRPSVKGKEGWRIDGTLERGECALLTPKGCSLTSGKRPRNCKRLEPRDRTGRYCKLHADSDRRAAAVAWLQYRELLEELSHAEDISVGKHI